MKILALVPARGGSKRLPGKNLRVLGDKPLIAWSILAAQNSGCCMETVVSTDCSEIASEACKYGASFRGLRPSELASDTASSADVAIQALDEYEADKGTVDGLLLLQPTSPFRSASSIRQAVVLFEATEGKLPVISVSPAPSHPAWCFRYLGGELDPFLGWEGIEKRSQDLESAYVLNGAIYLIPPKVLRRYRKFLVRGFKPLFMDNQVESLDIDTAADWASAELCLLSLEGKGA